MNRNVLSLVILSILIIGRFDILAQIDTFGLKCATSPVFSISEINGWRAKNVDFSNPEGPAPLCKTGGGAHNMSWWSFYTPGGNHTFEITFDNCTVNGTGVQFGIYKNCDFTEDVYCDPSCSGPGTKKFTASLDPLTLYYLFIDGCTGDVCDFILKTDTPKLQLATNVFIDENSDCIFQNTERSIDVLTIVHEFKGKKYFYPSNVGKIPLYDRDKGLHKFYLKESSSAIVTCQKEYEYNIDFTQAIPDLNIGISKGKNCEELQVEITTDRLRFCSDAFYYVQYQNISLENISNAFIDITIPAELTFVSSTIVPASINLPVIRFDLGTLNAMTKGGFVITLKTPCEQSFLGNTYCVEAHIYPDNPCPNGSSWDKSKLDLKASCDKINKKVKFIVKNIGEADMETSSGYAIIEDEIMPLLKGNIKLKMNEERVFEYPANGSTYRMILDQVSNHPGNSRPTKFVEGCGVDVKGETSKGFVLAFSNEDEDKFTSVDCKELRGSFDPNDKLAEPKGFGDAHYIEIDQAIEYTIRFQNTGNDNAEKVRIVDRLDNSLDLNTFEILGSSHEMSYSIREGIVEFIFDKIDLPYAKLNEPKSHGFASFRIKLKAGTQIGYQLNNLAEIYFDRNQPIITNNTQHVVWEPVITQVYNSSEYDFAKLFPNPASNDLFIQMRSESIPARLELINSQGHTIHHQNIISNSTQLNLEAMSLSSGVYLIQLRNNKGEVSIHKIMIKN